MAKISSRWLLWPAVLAGLAAAGLLTTAALAQTSGSGTITFTVAGEYGVSVRDVSFTEIAAEGSSSVAMATASDDHFFEITGPAGALTDEIHLRVTDVNLPADWVFVAGSATAGFDEVRLLYAATPAQTHGVYSVDPPVPIPSDGTVTIAEAGTDAPRGHYGGTLTIELGPRQSGGAGEAHLQITVTVVAAEPD